MACMSKQELAAGERIFTRFSPCFLLVESSKLDAVIADFVLVDLVRKLATEA